MKRKSIYRVLDFVKELQLNKREGLNCKVEDEVFSLANRSLPWKRVRCLLWPIKDCHGDDEVEGINEEVCGMW